MLDIIFRIFVAIPELYQHKPVFTLAAAVTLIFIHILYIILYAIFPKSLSHPMDCFSTQLDLMQWKYVAKSTIQI